MDEIREQLIVRPKFKWEVAETAAECEAVIEENWQAVQQWQKVNKPLVAMCSPDYYTVDAGDGDHSSVAGNGFVKEGLIAFEKNPEGNRQQMLVEWAALQETIAAKGADIIEMAPNPTFPDQVFTADHSFSCVYVAKDGDNLVEAQSKTVISQLAHPHRLNESDEVIAFFDSLRGKDAFTNLLGQRDIITARGKFEGTGDNLLDPYRGIILSGYGFRNNRDTLRQFHDVMGIPVFAFENKMPFFHIDTYCSILPGGYVMYAPDVMHADTLAELEMALFKGHESLKEKYAIHVSKEDAYAFCCNAVILRNDILMQPCSDKLHKTLEEKGMNVTFLNATIANYAGGGLHCMTNIINQPIFVNQALTLPQAIKDRILANKSKDDIRDALCQQYRVSRDELDSVYDEVKRILNDPAVKNAHKIETDIFQYIPNIDVAV